METILIVDDEEELRGLMGLSMEAAGYAIVEAGNGIEALAKLEAGLRPVAVLLDGHMPKMNGMETLSRIRAAPALKHLPVILVSAYGNESSIADAMARGASGYIVKPFMFNELPEQVKAILLKAA